ncbi:hypothetical protein PRIPAC_76815 [Pristionchus pacificus]|uniref:Uncharacterized protein n=1 Tax=Pristionchus pacificus TaxID=54126 RepID=A0A2A6BX47_PRIPA|nr:hypothetical protein PRIPAC_76815 [Pristionchus pacificus]|eukprot:PDM70448.1 hypothetical protein PRIPAC_46694 [Pristionchus pacificus]
MSTTTTSTEQSLDALLSELVQNADDWAALKSDLIDSPASPSSADGQHPCFDQLSRAISSHVTDLLLRRLRAAGRGEEENEDTDDEERPWIDERGRERRGRGFPARSAHAHARDALGSESLRSSRGSLSSRDSPASSGGAAVARHAAAPPPVVRGRAQARCAAASRTPSRAGSTCSLATIQKFAAFVREDAHLVQDVQEGSRYHSENRLDRAYPAPRTDETPLENRASRLRRMSIERRAAERNPRRQCRSDARPPRPGRVAVPAASSELLLPGPGSTYLRAPSSPPSPRLISRPLDKLTTVHGVL